MPSGRKASARSLQGEKADKNHKPQDGSRTLLEGGSKLPSNPNAPQIPRTQTHIRVMGETRRRKTNTTTEDNKPDKDNITEGAETPQATWKFLRMGER